MNKLQRKVLDEIVEKLESIRNDLEGLNSEEQDKFDNLPENLQESDRGLTFETNADILNCVVGEIESVINCLSQVDD